MSSKVSSRRGSYSSLGSEDLIEVPRRDVILSVNMKFILDKFHDEIEEKREDLAGATAELNERVERLVRKKEDPELELGRKTKLNEQVQAASKTFNGKVAKIKEFLEKKGVHNLESRVYTSEEIKAAAERLNKIH